MAVTTPPPAAQTRRPLTLADYDRIVALGDPQRSPDGQWVAYTVATVDAARDTRNTDIWMAKWDGSAQQPLTTSPDNETSPRWSPDGKYLAFLASRGTEEEKKKGAQLWLLPRLGGEAQKVSDLQGGLSDIQWAPDSTRLAFVQHDVDPADDPEKMEGWKRKTTPPIVIDRYRFKEDRTGYLTRHYGHIAVFDLASKTAVALTFGQVDDESPAWSADGQRISFLLEDDRSQFAASVPAEGGTPQRHSTAGMVVSALSPGVAGGGHAAILSTSNTLAELWAIDGGAPRQLTRHNAASTSTNSACRGRRRTSG